MPFHMFINIVHGIGLFPGSNLAKKYFTLCKIHMHVKSEIPWGDNHIMCASNLLSYVPPRDYSLFSFCKIDIIAKSEEIARGVCTTLNLTHALLETKFEALGTIVQFSKRFFNPRDNSTVKWNVIHTPHGISLFTCICILQNGKSEIIQRGVRTTINLNHTLSWQRKYLQACTKFLSRRNISKHFGPLVGKVL